jgi:type VI protein secretion system component VasK
MYDAHALPHLIALLAGASLLAFLMLWWIALGSRRFARRRRLRRRIEALRPLSPPSPAQDAALAALREAIAQACATLVDTQAPLGGGNSRLYAIPWFLFIGDTSADIGGLLAGAIDGSRAQTHAKKPANDRFWHWWHLPALMAIQTDAAVLDRSPTPRTNALWYAALLELVERRDRLPLNGVVVGVSASALLGNPDALAATAGRLHDRLAEVAALLRLHVPVYLVVTGLERLEGYAEFQAALPAATHGQAVGHRFAQASMGDGHRRPKVESIFGPIAQRLHALRMDLLRRTRDPARRLAIHSFVEQLRALEPGLETLANRIFDQAGPMPPRWRGLYLAAAPSKEQPGAFIADLFGRFLPADQPLARN